MREPTYFVLAALIEGPVHGYGIMQRSAELSGGRVKIAVGTLYGALDRLVTEGLVAVHGEEVVDGRFRRTYELTDHGHDAVRREAERLAEASAAVLTRTSAKSTPRLPRAPRVSGVQPS